MPDPQHLRIASDMSQKTYRDMKDVLRRNRDLLEVAGLPKSTIMAAIIAPVLILAEELKAFVPEINVSLVSNEEIKEAIDLVAARTKAKNQ